MAIHKIIQLYQCENGILININCHTLLYSFPRNNNAYCKVIVNMFRVGLLFVIKLLMNAAEIKQKLYDEIERADPRLLRMLYTLAKEYHSGDLEESRKRAMVEDDVYTAPTGVDPNLAEKRHAQIMEEHTKYLQGERKVYTWDEVKEIAKSNNRPNEA